MQRAGRIGQAPGCEDPAMSGQVTDRSQLGDGSGGHTGPPHWASMACGRSVHRSGQERGVGAEANSVATIRGSTSQRAPGEGPIV
jgi:hypothetical protein